MGATPKILVIIPAYNEEKSIVSVVESVMNAGYDYVVINDGSTDSTLRVCREHDINVVDLKCNLGIGGAVQTGHKYAQRHGYDVDIQFDGDGQHDVAYIPALLEGIREGNDLVVGSRFLADGVSSFQSTFMRRIGITWLSKLLKVVTGQKFTDPTSGFRACGPRAIELFAKFYPTDYPEPESIAEAHQRGLKVSEVPVSMNERIAGESSIHKLSSIYYMVKVTLAILITGSIRH